MDPHLKAMLEQLAAAAEGVEVPPLAVIPPPMVRAQYQEQRIATNQGAPKDVATKDLQIDGAAGKIPARLYTPAGAAATTPLLVYFHGGGFVIGDLETHDGHCRRMASFAGIRVLAVDYRLAPEFPFPASHDDAVAATRWAFDHAAEIGADPARIAVGGCSAGGNLAASVSISLKDDPKRRIAYQLLLYPGIWPEPETQSRKDLDGPLLTKEVMTWFETHLAADGHPDAWRVMLSRVTDLSGLPPALVVTAGYDPLKDEGRDYARRLSDAGVAASHVEYPDMVHDFYILGDVSPRIVEIAKETAATLKTALA